MEFDDRFIFRQVLKQLGVEAAEADQNSERTIREDLHEACL